MIKDIMAGDSAMAQLELANQHISFLEKKSVLQDSVIYSLKLKDLNNNEIINSEREKYGILKDYSSFLQESNKQLKIKNNILTIVLGAAIGGLTAVLVVK